MPHLTKGQRILIVYSSFGDGHFQVADAIRAALAERGAGPIAMVDLLAEAHPRWNALSRWAYFYSTTHCPWLYGISYDLTNPVKPNPLLSRAFLSIGRKKMRELVERLQPDALIHTFPYLAVQSLNARKGARIPSYTVVTDYVLHSRWVHPDTDGYFAATEQVKRSLVAAGVDGERVAVSGIPVRPVFERSIDKARVVAEKGLDPEKKYVLISAGAYGVLGQTRQMTETVLRRSSFDLILICGKNEKLFRRMQIAYRDEPRVRVIGFAERMEEWMAAASCLITKAGAVTLTEAMALGLPMIVYRSLPGQEQGNARVLSERGALLEARNPDELEGCLAAVCREDVRRGLIRAMQAVHRESAAARIADRVLHSAESVNLLPVKTAKRRFGRDVRRWRTN
ncbi:MGDG synthase family glycosyltransferase [Cohnella caldifontis]|uniref:MGDG synthase family glycosyltransferase n=1 Tax=Cohnella caldifontis TaxID=3027471 RepID=UPI0023EDF103|nr:glycosyltransferase [Cohnella sp. YIM B05605]